MSSLKGKRIIIIQQRNWGVNIGHNIAINLQKEGCVLGAITSKRSTHNFVMSQRDVKYEFIWSNDDIMGEPKKYLENNNYSLKEICTDLGIDSVWPIVHASRLHTKNYSEKFYFSFRQNVSDEGIVDYLKAVHQKIVKTFKEFKPDLIITPNFVSIFHLMLYYYAKKQGIKMLGINDSKIQGIYLFLLDPYDSEGGFHKRFNALEDNITESENTDKAREYIQEFRQKFKSPDYAKKIIAQKEKKGLYKKIRFQISPYYYLYRRMITPKTNLLKSIGVTPDYRPPRIILRDFYSYLRYERYMKRYKYYDLEKIEKFIYFPLQYQPEATIDIQAVYFSNQIETARLVAMSLPDDYTLVVKEHPAMVGYRPPSYIEKIARTPNVKLIDYRLPSEKILKRCSMVISPSSTTLAEAALLKIPGIQLGNLGTTLLLPNIIKHSELSTLSSKIKEHLNHNCDTEEYEKTLENYIAAVFDVGINFDYISAWEQGGNYEKKKLWEYYKKEIANILEIPNERE